MYFWICLHIVLLHCLDFSLTAYVRNNEGLNSLPGDLSDAETSIDLSNNAFETLGAAMFSQFTLLQVLRLDNNRINLIDPSAFNGTIITHLYLSDNDITVLPDLRCINVTLQLLYLDGNDPLKSYANDSLILKDLTKLSFIELSRTRYNSVGAISLAQSMRQLFFNSLVNLTSINNAMRNLSNVFRLELAANIKLGPSFDSTTFVGLSSLFELNIRDVGLIQFPRDALLPLNDTLEKLYLDKNPISSIQQSDLEPFKNLKRLYMNYATLSEFPEISPLQQSLEQLTLAGNNIKVIPDFALDGFENLNYINLASNPIDYLPDFGSATDNIETLDIHGMKLLYLDSVNASKFSSLKFVRAGGDTQYFTDLSNFTEFSSLESLTFIGGAINSVSSVLFANLTNLASFRLTSTRVTCMSQPPKNKALTITLEKVVLFCDCCWSWSKEESLDFGTTIVNLNPGDAANGLSPCEQGPSHLKSELNWQLVNLTDLTVNCTETQPSSVWSTVFVDGTSHGSEITTELFSPGFTSRKTSVKNEITLMSTTSTNSINIDLLSTLASVPEERLISWDEWMDWTSCTVSCGGGTQIRVRICQGVSTGGCTHLIPVAPGKVLGYQAQSRSCRESPCPVDGKWEGWLEWESCRSDCGISTRTRRRRCAPLKYGGHKCVGSSYENDMCHLEECQEGTTSILADGEESDNDAPFGVPRLLESDRRPSAISVGTISVIVLASCVVAAFLLDVPTLKAHMSRFCLYKYRVENAVVPRKYNARHLNDKEYDDTSTASISEVIH